MVFSAMAGLTDAGPALDPGEAVIVYMGHDSNLSSIRAVLDFNREAPERVLNAITPGGMLMFGRVRRAPSADDRVA